MKKLEQDLKIKAEKSTKEYNNFTIENRLGSIDGFIELGQDDFTVQLPNAISSKIDIESFRTDTNIPQAGQRFQAQFMALERYESEYVELKGKLKPNSKYLKSFKKKIDNLRNSLKRPNEILIKYRKLYLESKRNNELLSNVEDNLSLIHI